MPYEQIIAFCEHEGLDISYVLLGEERPSDEQPAYDLGFLREVIIGVEEFLDEEKKDLAPADKAELITTLFTEAQKMEAEGVEASSRAFRLSRLIARFVGSH